MNYLLASDGSSHSIRAARWLVDHLPLDQETEIFLVYVFPLPPDADTLSHLIQLPTDSSDERVCEVARPALDRTRAALDAGPVKVHEVVLVGNPAKEIVAFAGTQKVDLIVTGNRGRGAVQELYLGSVSAAVAHRALCPVLLVR